jgi:hypothetical protein
MATRLHSVRAEQDGLALVAQREDQGADIAPADGVEPRHRLVEDHEIGVLHQRLRHPQPLHHALRVAPHRQPPLGAEADAVEQGGGAAAGVARTEAAQLAVVRQQFLAGEVVVEDGVLRQEADARAGGHVGHRHAEQPRGAGGRRHQAHEELERGALAGTVRPQAPEHLACRDRQSEVVEGAIGPGSPEADRIVLREVFDGDDRISHGLPARRPSGGPAPPQSAAVAITSRLQERPC